MKTITLIAAIFAVSFPAFACYSGLALIPTADIVGAKQYGIEMQVDGSISKPKADTYILNTEYGVTNRLELGIDYDFSKGASSRLLFNGKYVFLNNEDEKLAIAAGICNVGKHTESNPYMAATKDFNYLRGHAGVIKTGGKLCGFIGADKDLTDKINLMADYTNGNDNNSSLGCNYQFTDNTALLSGIQFPNNSGEVTFTLHLCFSGSVAE